MLIPVIGDTAIDRKSSLPRLRNLRRLNPHIICGKMQKCQSPFFVSPCRSWPPFHRWGALHLIRPWPHVTGFKPQSLTFPYVSYVLSYRTLSRVRTPMHACHSHAFVHAHRPLKFFIKQKTSQFLIKTIRSRFQKILKIEGITSCL